MSDERCSSVLMNDSEGLQFHQQGDFLINTFRCGSDPLHLPAVEGEGDVVLRTVNTTSVVFVVRMSSFSPSGPKHNTRGEHSN